MHSTTFVRPTKQPHEMTLDELRAAAVEDGYKFYKQQLARIRRKRTGYFLRPIAANTLFVWTSRPSACTKSLWKN